MSYTFAGTIASWITSDWELVERVLNFHPIEDKEHEGEYEALGLAKRLNDFKALEKISYNFYKIETSLTYLFHLLAVVLDNASPNDVLLRALARLLQEKFDLQFVPANSQIRCLAHVVNLVVQKILAALGNVVDPDVTDDYLPNKDVPFHYNPDNDPALDELEREVFDDKADSGADEDEVILLNGLASTWWKVIFSQF
jgi:hypothetical protein